MVEAVDGRIMKQGWCGWREVYQGYVFIVLPRPCEWYRDGNYGAQDKGKSDADLELRNHTRLSLPCGAGGQRNVMSSPSNVLHLC